MTFVYEERNTVLRVSVQGGAGHSDRLLLFPLVMEDYCRLAMGE